MVKLFGDSQSAESRGRVSRYTGMREKGISTTDRRWEQGEDLSLVEFKTVEYEGSKHLVASDEIKLQILKAGIRKVERETGVSHNE